MNYAILFNVFTCWMVTVASWAATRALVRRDARPGLQWQALAWVWNFAALLWFFAGARLLVYFFYVLSGQNALLFWDRGLFYLDEVCLAGQIVAACIFGCEAIWKNARLTRAIAAVAMTVSMVFLILLFYLGVAETIHTNWASEHELPRLAFAAFAPVYAMSVALSVMVVGKEIVCRIRNASWADSAAALAALGLLLYGVAGVMDVRGTWGGWRLLLVRQLYLVAALITFWVAGPAEPSVRLVRPGGQT